MEGLFFFNDTATTEIYTLSLHDALPISLSYLRHSRSPTYYCHTHRLRQTSYCPVPPPYILSELSSAVARIDRKSTRLNSSHANISYAVFCLKKKIHHYIVCIDALPLTTH